MSTRREVPLATTHIHRLIELAWLEVKQARRDADIGAMLKAEKRVDALLEELHARVAAAATA